MIFIIPAKLNYELKQMLKTRVLSSANINSMYQKITEKNQKETKVLMMVTIGLLAMSLAMILSVAVESNSQVGLILFLALVSVSSIVFIVGFIKVIYIDSIKRQFKRSVYQYYPELKGTLK